MSSVETEKYGVSHSGVISLTRAAASRFSIGSVKPALLRSSSKRCCWRCPVVRSERRTEFRNSRAISTALSLGTASVNVLEQAPSSREHDAKDSDALSTQSIMAIFTIVSFRPPLNTRLPLAATATGLQRRTCPMWHRRRRYSCGAQVSRVQ